MLQKIDCSNNELTYLPEFTAKSRKNILSL